MSMLKNLWIKTKINLSAFFSAGDQTWALYSGLGQRSTADPHPQFSVPGFQFGNAHLA